MNLENAGTDSHTLLGIPFLPLARGLLMLALVQIGLKNKKGREKYYSTFSVFLCGLSVHLLP